MTEFYIKAERECRQSTIVELDVHTDLDVELLILPFKFDAGKQYSAALLQNYLNNKITQMGIDRYKDGYEEGIKQGIRLGRQQARKELKKKKGR